MWFTVVIIVGLLVAGAAAHKMAGKDDSPAEQLAETVLEAQGVNIDFSAEDKKNGK